MKGNRITATIFIAIILVCCAVVAVDFLAMHEDDLIISGEGVTEIKMLSDYFPDLEGTAGDTAIYIFEGEEEGGSMLVLGGTHPNEPAGYMSAVMLIENAVVDAGTLYVIPQSNRSAFTHNDSQEASPQNYSFETENGTRTFTYGSRATNPIDQWPDPDVYIHSSGQQLSGSETRNLNRAYPGDPDGTFTEKITYGITTLIKEEDIKVTVDLHEASPEYPVINAIVAHDDAMPLASQMAISMQMQGVQMGIEPSPVNLRGLTHRELGDFTDTLAVLMETANPSQGRLRGATDEDLALTGIDDLYVKAEEAGRLYVPFDESGHPIAERVGRHLLGIQELANGYTSLYSSPIVINNMPSYDELIENGIGNYLQEQ